MHKSSSIPDRTMRNGRWSHILCRLLIPFVLVGLLMQVGCLFRKRKPPAAPTASAAVRIVLLPLNGPSANAELRWMSLAAPVLLSESSLAASDLEPVPLWQSMPTALQSLGNSRTVTTDLAELAATRLSARWGVQGDLRPANGTISISLDFIPSKTTLVPFRYEKQSSLDDLQSRFQDALEEFIRYLIIRPLDEESVQIIDVKKLKEIADAVDVEYGWFSAAKPGSSGKLVEELATKDPELARLLFSPTLYPILAK